jgi:phosphate starvation-inducible PhoH-like protein
MISILKFSYLLLLFPKNYLKNNIRTILYSKKKIELPDKAEYTPKSSNQEDYLKSLNDKNIDLLFCQGPAGTGKTLFACNYAIKRLKENNIKKIIITRPMITVEENMGFLPGDINDKMLPFMNPIFDIFLENYTKKELDSLIYNNIVEVAPLGFIQGRTFKNSIIIADEMQNSSPTQMFMLLTRIGDNSRMIITGDPMQTVNKNNGLVDIITKFDNNYNSDEELYKDGIKIVKMKSNDIQRHRIVTKINLLYDK